MKKCLYAFAAVLSVAFLSGQPGFANTVTLDTGAPTSNKYGFGAPSNMPTYGESFTAPITGYLTSFTLYLTEATNGSFNLVGGVDTWNAASTSAGTNLYTSAPVAVTYTGFPPAKAIAYTFTTNVAVTQGLNYIAFLSMFNVAGAGGNGQMPFQFTGSKAPAAGGGGHMYWTSSSPFTSGGWTTDGSYPGWAEFQATFTDVTPTPLPAALPLFATGAGLMGILGWWRKRKAADAGAIA